MLTLNDGRSELWQWDTGRKLTVDADCTQVHFSNKVFGRSIDVDVVDGTAEIPDILLQVDKELHVWAFVGTAENGYTKISKVFKVNKRNKPADYVFTPTEQTTLKDVLERIEKLEEKPDAGVDPVAKTDDMTNPVGVDADGLLWTAPRGGGGSDLLDENGIIKKEYFPEGFPYRRIADPVIMPGTTLTADPDSGKYTIPNTINTLALSADTRCAVKFEVLGYVLKFEVTPQKAPGNDQGLKWVLGNIGLLGDEAENTGEPFLIGLFTPEVAAEAGIGGIMAFAYDAESVMLSIDLVDESFSTIDPSYLPSNCETVVVIVVGKWGGDITTTHTQNQIIALLREGKNVILDYRGHAEGNPSEFYRPVYCSNDLVEFSQTGIYPSPSNDGKTYVRYSKISTSADISGWTEMSGYIEVQPS